MKKLNSNDFHEIKNYNYNKNDINVNLWDLEGSNFFIDKNYNESESKRSRDPSNQPRYRQRKRK